MTAPQTGYLVIVDISGYTAFLSQSELEHARDSLNSLLGLLVEYTRRPRWRRRGLHSYKRGDRRGGFPVSYPGG